MAAPNVNSNYYNTAGYKQGQNLQNETIQGLGQKYGFDFSQGYANQQAQSDADNLRLAQQAAARDNNSTHSNTMNQIRTDYNSGARTLDTNYFKQYQGNSQDMANRGLNAGIAAASNVQLGLGKQHDLGGLWDTRMNATSAENSRYGNSQQTIDEALAQIQKDQSLNAKKYYQDGLNTGYGYLNSDRNYGLQLQNSAWGQYQDMFNNNISSQQLALQQQAAARASAAASSRGSGGSGSRGSSSRSSGGGGVALKGNGNSALNSALGAYNSAKPSVSKGGSVNTPLDKYAYSVLSNPGVQAVATSNSPLVHQYFPNPYSVDPTSVANTSALSPWDKMKLMGG